MNEQVHTVGGVALKPRNKVDPKKPRKRKNRKLATPEEEQNEAQSMEELAKVSDAMDLDARHVVNITSADGSDVEVEIYKCKARQLGHVMRFLALAFKEMKIENMEDAEQMTVKLSNPGNILAVISGIVDEAMETACMLTSLDAETMAELEIDAMLAVIVGVWTVNQAFFLSRVMPQISQLISGGVDPDTST